MIKAGDFFKTIGYMFLGLCSFIVFVYLYALSEQTWTSIHYDAEYENFNYLQELELELQSEDVYHYKRKLLFQKPSRDAHEIKNGNGVVISYHWRSADDLNVSHDVHFEKATIWLRKKQILNSKVIVLHNNPQVKIIYTKGNRVERAKNCSGVLNKGKLFINNDQQGYNIRIAANVTSLASLSRTCKDEQLIDLSFGVNF